MSLKHCIIHGIQRPVPGADIQVFVNEKEEPTEGPIASLFEQYRQGFQRSALKQFGHFGSDVSTVLPGLARDFHEGKSSFIKMTQTLIGQMKDALEKYEEPFNAKILFAVDDLMEQDQFYIFWINHVEALQINKLNEIQYTEYIDPAKVTFAFKLKTEQWLEESSNQYLTLLGSRGNPDLNEVLEEYAGFTKGLDKVEQTEEFLSIVEEFADAMPDEQDAREYRSQVMDYCLEQDKTGLPVNVNELSFHVDQKEPTRFAQFAQERQTTPTEEIHTDRARLKRYVRFSGRDKNLTISFSSDRFGEGIVYDSDSDTLIIKEIPKSLKQQLVKHQLKSGDSE
jgi:nucleoid-associated protein